MAKVYKLVVFVPVEHADHIRQVLGDAGCGKLGNYSHCSFSSRGVGRFKPLEGASPAIGTVGEPEEVEEERIEVVVDEQIMGNVLARLKEAHPYEEVAYDIYERVLW